MPTSTLCRSPQLPLPFLVLAPVVLALVVLAVPPAGSQNFRLGTLTADQCRTVEHTLVTGDDRGAIAVGAEHVLYTGDIGTTRFDLDTLGDATSFSEVYGPLTFYDALTSNLRTGEIYTFAYGDSPIVEAQGTATALLLLDPISGHPSGQRLLLSRPVELRFPTGFFAGWDRVAVHTDGEVVDIDLRDGRVRPRGAVELQSPRLCEIGAFWGVAEDFAGELHLAYRDATSASIVRTRVRDGATSTVAEFDALGDLCAFSVAPRQQRWYFHHEFFSELADGEETLGYCDASVGSQPAAELTLDAATPATAVAVGSAFEVVLTVRNDGPRPAGAGRLDTRLPAAARLLSATPSQGRCHQGCRNLACELGRIPAGAEATVTLELGALLGGPLEGTSRAGSRRADRAPDDDRLDWQVEVERDGGVLVGLGTFSDALHVLDSRTGATRSRIPLRLPGEEIFGGRGLSVHPATAELWALLGLRGETGFRLAVIDPGSGEVRGVGGLELDLRTLAFDDAGRLWSNNSEGLFNLDLETAAATLVAPLPGDALAFDPGIGRLVQLVDESWRTIDPDLLDPENATGPDPAAVPLRPLDDAATCGGAPASFFFPFGALAHLGGVVLEADELLNLFQITSDGQRTAVGFLDVGLIGLARIAAPAVDLAVTQAAAPTPATAGEPLTTTVTVENRGPETAMGVTLFDHLPMTASLVATRPPGICGGDPVFDLACMLGELAPGERATVEIETVPWAGGTIVNAAETPGVAELEPDDNAVALEVEVVAAADAPTLLSLDRRGSTLHVVDPTTGATLSSGRLELEGAELDRVVINEGFAMAAHPRTGELWALLEIRNRDEPYRPPFPELVRVDPVSRRATRIGMTSEPFRSLTVGTDGRLFASTADPSVYDTGQLFVLDTETAGSTFLLELLSDGVAGSAALAFHPDDGLLYAALQIPGPNALLVAVDPSTLERSAPILLPRTTAERPRAMTHLGGDRLLLYDRSFAELRSTGPTGGVRPARERLRHASRGLAIVAGVPRPRLALEQSVDQNPAVEGRPLTFTLTARNDGDTAVDDVVLRHGLVGPVGGIEAVASQGGCTLEMCRAELVCELGRLEPGASATVEVSTRPLAAGTVTGNARVEPEFGDPDISDNTSILDVRVRRRAGTPERTLLSLGTLATVIVDAVRLHVVDPGRGTTRSTLEVTVDDGSAFTAGRGLAVHPVTGEVWALAVLDGRGDATELVTLAPHTGVARRVATLVGDVRSLAFDGAGTPYGLSPTALVRIDPASGAVTEVAALASRGAIAWNPSDGRMWHAAQGRLEAIDPSSGEVTQVAPCGSAADALVHLGEEIFLATGHSDLTRLDGGGGRALVGLLDHASSGLAWVDLARGDLAVDQRVAPRRARVGEPFTLTARIENLGTTPIPHAALVERLSGALRVDAVTSTRGSCAVELCGGAVRCELGSLAGGARATVRITVTPLAAGTFEADATAPALDDPDLSDNQVLTPIPVDPPAGEGSQDRVLLAIDADGRQLRVVDPATAATLLTRELTVLAAERLLGAVGLTAHPATGELYTLLDLYGTQTLAAVQGDTGVVRPVGVPPVELGGLAFGADGVLYGLGTGPPALFTVDLDDASTTFVSGLAASRAMAADGAGRLWHLLTDGDRILRSLDPAGGAAEDHPICATAEAGALAHLGGEDFLAVDGRLLARISASGEVVAIGHLAEDPGGLAFAAAPAFADLRVTQRTAPDPAVVGGPLTWTVHLENAGPAALEDTLTLIETLPPTVTLRGLEASRGSCHADLCGAVACELGGLAAGETAAVTLETVPWAAGAVTGAAEAPVVNDPEPGDNRSEWTVEVEPASRRRALVSVNGETLFVVDPLDGSTLARRPLRFEDGSPAISVGIATHPQTGVLWSLLAGGVLATVDPVSGAVQPVGGSGEHLTNLAFDADGTLYSLRRDPSVSPALVALSLVDGADTTVLELDNTGRSDALAFHPASGRLLRLRGQLELQAIDPAALEVAEIPACPRPPQDFFRPTALTHAGGDTFFLADDDSNLFTLTALGVVRRSGRLEQRSRGLAFVDLAFADLAVSQTVSGPAQVGEPLTVEVRVTNQGPDDVPAASLVSTLPGIAGLVALAPSQGTCRRLPCGAEVVCELGSLVAGASATVDLELMPHLPGELVSVADLPGINDPDPANDRATLSVEIAPDDAVNERRLFLVPQEGDRLWAVDPVSGADLGSAAIRLGSERILGGRGLARHPTTGELWALLDVEGQDTAVLAVIDPTTGVARQVGSTGHSLSSLAFDGGGGLWSVRVDRDAPDELHRLDPSDASSQLVHVLTEPPGGGDLVWNPTDGLLWRFAGSFTAETFDPATGRPAGERRVCDVSLGVLTATWLGGDVMMVAELTSQSGEAKFHAVSAQGGVSFVGRSRRPGGMVFAELRAPAALSISQSDTPDPVIAGETLTYTIEVENEGSETAPAVSLVDRLPGTASLVSVSSTHGACRSEVCGPVVCGLGDLASGGRATVTVEVVPLVPGTVVSTALAPVFSAAGETVVTETTTSESTAVLAAGRRPAIVSLADGELRQLDPGSGATIGAIGLEAAGVTLGAGRGLAVDPLDGQLWALTEIAGPYRGSEPSRLVVVDPASGSAEVRAEVDGHLVGLAIDGDGGLWSTRVDDYGRAALLRIDRATGISTEAVELGAAAPYGSARVAWNSADGLLYVTVGGFDLRTVDPRDLTVRELASCGREAASGLAHLERDILVTATGGELLGVSTAGGLVPIGPLDHASGGLAVLADLPLADLRVSQRASSPTVAEGETVTWTVTVENAGPDVAAGVRLTDELPATLSVVDVSTSHGSCRAEACSGGLGCDLGDLAAGSRATVTLTARVLTAGEPGGLTHRARVSFLGDPDPGDNLSESTVSVRPSPPQRVLLSLDAEDGVVRQIDPATGATLARRPITLPGFTVLAGRGLVANPATGEVWALLALTGHSHSALAALDPTTGVARFVGETGRRLVALAVTDDGLLVAVEEGAGNVYPEERLVAIDPATGEAATLLELAERGAGREGEGLALQPLDGRLYRVSGGLDRSDGGFVLSTIELAPPSEAPIAACGEPVGQVAALTHFGDDVFLLADAEGRDLFAVTTAGGLRRAGDLDHTSGGLAFVPAGPMSADLGAVWTAPATAAVGELLTATATVTNAGATGLDAVTFFASLPGAVAPESIVPSQGACGPLACGGFTCDLGPLGVGESARVRLAATPLLAGTLRHEAVVPLLGDLVPEDNTAVLETAVEGFDTRGPLLSIFDEEPFLQILDAATGTVLASHRLALSAGDGASGGEIFGGAGLAVEPRTGEVWAVLELGYSGDQALATLDPETGRAVLRGTPDQRLGDLAFDAAGTLWAVASTGDRMFPVDLDDASTGVAVPLSDLGGYGSALAFDPDAGRFIHGAFGPFLESVDPVSGGRIEVARCHAGQVTVSGADHLGGGTLLLALDDDQFRGSVWAATPAGSLARLFGLDHISAGVALLDLPPADLAVDQTAGPAVAGEPFTYRVTVTNHGPEEVPAPRLRSVPPALGTATSRACIADGCGALTCGLGPLASGAEATVEIGFTPFFPGPLVNEVEALLLTDPLPEDNRSVLETTAAPGVTPAASLLVASVYADGFEVLDPATGELLSTLAIFGPGGVPVSELSDLAIHPETGAVWTVARLDGTPALLAIDPTTGLAEPIGDPGPGGLGLAFMADGSLWGVRGSELLAVSVDDASTRSVLTFDGTVSSTLASNPRDGRLYTLGTSASGGRALRAVDPGTSTVTDIELGCRESLAYSGVLAYLGDDALLLTGRDASYDLVLLRLTTGGDLARVRTLPNEEITGMALVTLP